MVKILETMLEIKKKEVDAALKASEEEAKTILSTINAIKQDTASN
jgi:hypothetical protein